MKRLIPILLIVTWILFNSSGKKSEWYLKVYDQETIIRVPRDQYLEFYDLLYENDVVYKNTKKQTDHHLYKRAYLRVKTNEYETWERKKDTMLINKIQRLTWN